MPGQEGYTGPTSGRITIGGDGTTRAERFTDHPLTREEADAVAWFTALSPNEQLREVRRLKWNLGAAEKGQEGALRRAREAEVLYGRLAAERDARRPDGYELPRAASELLSWAVLNRWGTARRWTLSEDKLAARLELGFSRAGWALRLTWIVPVDGRGRGSLHRRGLLRRPDRDWEDAPSLKKIRLLMAQDPED